MRSRLLAGLGLVVSCFLATAGFAQAKSEAELSRDVLQAERKLLVSRNLELTESEGKAFWSVYDKYAADQRKLNDRLVQTIEAFAAEYDKLTDDRAVELLEESMAIREDRNKLRRSYLDRFSKAVPGKKLARFYQIDNKLDVLLDALIADAIPLVQ